MNEIKNLKRYLKIIFHSFECQTRKYLPFSYEPYITAEKYLIIYNMML